MDCKQLEDLLSDYVDALRDPRAGSLDRRIIAQIDAHLSHCEPCRFEVRQLRRTVAMLRSLPPLEPPAYFVHAVHARLAETPPSRTQLLQQWLFPSKQGFAVRLAATAILLTAVIPTVRRPVVHGALSLVDSLNTSRPGAVQPSGAHPSGPTVEAPNAPNPISHPSPALSGSEPGAPASTGTGQPPAAPGLLASPSANSSGDTSATTAPTAASRLPEPLLRPVPSDFSLQFKIEGQTQPGSVMMVTATAMTGKDLTDASMDANLSEGAHFLNSTGRDSGVRQHLWAGNLAEGAATSESMQIVADRPGIYDLRVQARAGGQASSADLLLPVGLRPTALQIDTTAAGPTDLYTALSTLAAQSARPIAVEDGLTGTTDMSLQPKDFEAGLSGIAHSFGCGFAIQNGVGQITLHPDRSRPAPDSAVAPSLP